MRTACTTVPDLPRAHAPRPVGRERLPADRRGGALPPPGLRRARALLRGAVRLARHRTARRPSGCPGSATATPAAWAPTSWSTTCSTSCCSRCRTTTPTPTRSGPTARLRSIAEADRALERIMHVAGGAEAFLEDHAVIVMSDHSQTAVEDGDQPLGGLRDARVLTPGDVAPTEAELAACPSARSAMVYALDEGRRDELVRGCRRHAGRGRRHRPGDHRRGRGGRGALRPRGAALRSPAAS